MDGFASQNYCYTMMPSILHKSSKHCLKNIPFVMAKRFCAKEENNSFKKNKHLRELKENFRICGYPEKVVEIGIQKALKIYQTELRQAKTIENNDLTFISIFNPNNPKIFGLLKSGVNTLVKNNVNCFKNIKLIHAKLHPPNLKRTFTITSLISKTAVVFKCSDSRCLCCQQLLLESFYSFKNVHKKTLFKNENDM